MAGAFRVALLGALAWSFVSAQDVLNSAWQQEFKGDGAGAREFIERVIKTSPNSASYQLAYAQLLERQRQPQVKEAYERALSALKASNAPADQIAAVERRVKAHSALAATSSDLKPAVEQGIITIPGPLRSFARMAALSPDLRAEDLLPALARNVVTNGYQASNSAESLEQTEYLKLVVRYLSQARELEKLAGAENSIKIEQCESAQTGELLKVIGYRMRGGCGAEVVLETVNAMRAFITIDSGFPIANLEQALRANRPFAYDYKATQVPVLYGADYWLSAVREKQGEFIDTFLGDPSLCRLYLGISKLDPATAADLRKTIAAPRLKVFAHVLDFFGGMFQIRNGKAVVPGGAKSEKMWGEMAGAPPEQGAAFFDKLLSKDDGWLAAYYDALSRIGGPTKDYLTDPERMKRFFAAVRGKVTSPGPARPVFRANTDMMLLTTRLRVSANGKPHIPGSVDIWKNLFVNHPHGKYDGKLTKSAAGWKEPDDVLEALFGLSRKAVENEPLKIFMALTDMDRLREKPLAPATVDRLAREYRTYSAQLPILTEVPSLSDATILAFLDTATAVYQIKDNLLRADTAGSLQALISTWQILCRQNAIPVEEADKTLSTILASFSKIKSTREVFDASRSGLTLLLETAKADKNLNYQERVIELLAGSRVGDEAQTAVVQDMIRGFESQRLISLQTIFELDDNLQAVAKGGKLDQALVKRLAARISEVQLPRASLSSIEKNSLAFGYWTEKHIDNQRKLNIASVIDKSGTDPEKLKDLRGLLAPILRDTLVGFVYLRYAPPGAQVLHTNPVFVRSHDFIGLQGTNQTWKHTEVFGTGWPASAGGRLVGSLVGLPYAIAEAEQNFLIPTREQALIWGDLVPQMILSATVPRWWDVSPAQMHWVGMHMAFGEALIAEASFDKSRKEQILPVLDRFAPPARLAKVEHALANGNPLAALDQIVPAELFALAHEVSKQDSDPLAASIRKATQDVPGVGIQQIGKAFGTPKPTLANSYHSELLNLRSFPTLMGYSSRIMAETWESNLLYYAALADEVSMPPAQLNVAVKDWTRQTVERIFATHLEDWPALLRSLRSVGDEVRDRARKQLPLTQRTESGSF